MNVISIHLDQERRCFRPGDKLAGSVEWELDNALASLGRDSRYAAAKHVEVRLFWFTTGSALKQVGVVSRLVLKNLSERNSGRFEFILPAGPWCFAGRIVSLHWAAEAVLFPSRESAIVMFSFGPDGQRVNPFRTEEPESEFDELGNSSA